MDPRWICFWVGVSVTAVPCLVIGGWFMLFLLRVPDEEHDGYWREYRARRKADADGR